MFYEDINSLSQKHLEQQIEIIKGKVIFGSHVKHLCDQINHLNESLNQVMVANEKITSELVIVKNVNVDLES